jgi:uncharacterized membrane protein YdjX (TVP38/TMEM64 family)
MMSLVVFAVSLIPVFGPPSWILVMFYTHAYHLALIPTVLLAAFSTAFGRYVLALIFRYARNWLPAKALTNLDAAKSTIRKNRGGVWAITGLFVLSPLPSAQLFEAAGLLEVKLLPLTAAFMAGRLVTYSIYVSSANFTISNVKNIWSQGYLSPTSIVLQILMLTLVIALFRYKKIVAFVRRHSSKNQEPKLPD